MRLKVILLIMKKKTVAKDEKQKLPSHDDVSSSGANVQGLSKSSDSYIERT